MVQLTEKFIAMTVTLIFMLLPTTCLSAIYNPTTGHYYEIVSSGFNGSWINAQNNAELLGGHLVTINDAAEEQWLRDTFGKHTRYWIGLNDSKNEGSFVWSSGEPVTYTHWSSGEPNNCTPPSYGEDFVVMNWDIDTGAWNDWDHLRSDYIYTYGITEIVTPIPAALWLFLSSIVSVFGFAKSKKKPA